MPWLVSVNVSTLSTTAGSVKLGHPVPEPNLVPEWNRSAPHPAQRYIPLSLAYTYLPVNGGSVPFNRSTSYCSGASSWRHSSSVLLISAAMGPLLTHSICHANHLSKSRFWRPERAET